MRTQTRRAFLTNVAGVTLAYLYGLAAGGSIVLVAIAGFVVVQLVHRFG